MAKFLVQGLLFTEWGGVGYQDRMEFSNVWLPRQGTLHHKVGKLALLSQFS